MTQSITTLDITRTPGVFDIVTDDATYTLTTYDDKGPHATIAGPGIKTGLMYVPPGKVSVGSRLIGYDVLDAAIRTAPVRDIVRTA